MGRYFRRGERSLDREIGGAFRAMLIGITVILVATSIGFGWLAYVSDRDLDRLDNAVDAVQDAHAALVDEETAIRGYVTTGSTGYLDPYTSGVRMVRDANRRLDSALQNPTLAPLILDFRLTQQQWQTQWADKGSTDVGRSQLLDPLSRELDQQAVALYLSEGKELFDRYRVTQTTLLDEARDQRAGVQHQQNVVMTGLVVSILLVCFVLGSVAGIRRRRLGREVITPIHGLVDTIDDVAAGRLVEPPEVRSCTEVVELRDGLASMVRALTAQRDAATVQAGATEETASRLRAVLKFAREVSGSLSVRYVLDAVTTAACSITGAERARVWLVDDTTGTLRLAFDSKIGRKGQVDELDWPMGSGAIGRAAKYGQVSYSGDVEGDTVPDGGGESVVGFPLIVGARVIGVLEIETELHQHFDDELLELVETLAGHSAAALEAARLYQDTEAMSTSDALTGLSNRRRLDSDLATEVELANRHGRALGFVMLDLDHFKRVNDTYGHQQGDQILQDVAAILRSEARPGDSVYRYGGEELAIVVRESDAEGAFAFAERIRDAVERRFTRAGTVTQTLSAGVAAVPDHASTAGALVAAADAALYVAKQNGRNRVELAGETLSPLTAADFLGPDVSAQRT